VYIRERRMPRSQVAAYNSRKPTMSFSLRVCGACFALIIASQIVFASDWRAPEAQLSEKIAAVTGPGVIALDVVNRSSISSADAEQVRRELTSLLAASGIRVWQPDQAAATVKLTLSENLQDYVWVAQIQQATNEAGVVMVAVARPASISSAQNAPPLTLHVTPLLSQTEPILDLAVIEGSPRRMLVLGRMGVTIHEFRDGHWVPGQSLVIKTPVPLPRDLRGRIFLRKDHLFDAYLPGRICRSSGLSMSCQQSDDPWPLETEDLGVSGFFSPVRNFFTGALVPGVGKQKSAPTFYSAAAIPRQNYTLWVLTGLDGQLHLLDGINDQVATKIHWGSDIVGIRTACRQTAQVIATAPGEDSQDSLQAFEFPDREPLAVSQKLALQGTVTALWTAQTGDTATAVIKNSDTGKYDAVQINLTCGQ
jgi:hypothetical protein